MQALSVWPSKGEFLTLTHFKFELGFSRTCRRNRILDFDDSLSQHRSSHFLFVSSSLRETCCQAHRLQCGFPYNQTKLNFVLVCEPKKNSSGASFALALALEEEAVGNGVDEEGLNRKDGLFEKSDSINGDEVESSEEIVGKDDDEEGDKRKNKSELGDDMVSAKVDVRALALSLHSAKTADDVEEVLKEFNELPPAVYSTMIKGLGVDKKLDSAMALVEWLRRKKEGNDGLTGPNLYIYNSLLGAVKQCQQFQEVEKIMKEMEEEGVVPNVVTYNTLMSIHLEQGQHKEALSVLEDIREMGISPCPVSYSTALLAYRRMEDGNGALKFFVELREKYHKGEIGNEVDKNWESEFVKLENFIIRICYQVMRRWLVQGDRLTTDVLKLLVSMDSAGLKPSRAEYERLIWACTLEGHYKVAKELYSRVRERELKISLSVCNHVIWVMGKAKKWWAALEVYEDLLDKGPEPNNLSYELVVSHFNVLLSSASRRGIWRWGVRLLNKMEEKGLRPGSRQWNAVLVACSRAAETTAAVQVFLRMVENGEKPTILSYGALLSALEKGRLYDKAIQVWEHMVKVGLQPNVYAYTIMASVYSGQGKSEMVDSIIQQMIASGIDPTVVTFNAIISGCARNGMGSTAFEWFHRLKVWNVEPNEITYEMLIDALARDAKPRLAYELYLRAQSEGLKLSSKAYDAVVQSATDHSATIDVSSLGFRPPEKKKQVKTRKNLKEFCRLADVPRRSKPFDRKELESLQIQGNE